MWATVSRGIESRRETPPPIRHSMIVSERLPLSLVLAPASWVPLGRWSVPSTSTVSVPVIMFEPEASALVAEAGSEPPLWVEALTMKSTNDSSSQATIASASHLSTRRGADPAPRGQPAAAPAPPEAAPRHPVRRRPRPSPARPPGARASSPRSRSRRPRGPAL